MDPEFLEPLPLFRLFTKESVTKIEKRIIEKKQEKENRNKNKDKDEETKEEDKIRPNPALEVGKSLPMHLGEFPPELHGKPIEDIDEFYHDKYVFMVVAKDKTIFRFNAHRALFLLTPFNPVRRGAIYILTHPFFSLLVMLVILVNCVFMAIKNEILYAETIFTVIYTIEGLIKMLARGFILASFTYLRDMWNWLDFMVVALAYLTELVDDLGNFAALRTFRVLRALKTVAVVPGLKTIVGALMEAVRRLRDVMILTVFVLSIFALIGLQIYQGALKNKCIMLDPEFDENATEREKDVYYSNSSYWFMLPGSKDGLVCGDGGGGACPTNYTCRPYGRNPNYGYTNFDNFAWALLCAFRLMTQDYWENLYQLTIRAQGPWHMLFFVLVIFMGSFYLVNLILAIVAMSYDEQQKQDQEEEDLEEEEAAAAQEMEDNRRLAIEAIEAAGRKSPSECSYFENDFYIPRKPMHDKERISLKSDEVAMMDARRLSIVNSKGKKASLSLPPSPFNRRRASRASQFSWRRHKKGHSPRAGDRQPLVIFPCLDNLDLPYVDESNAVTPTSDELCNWQNTHGFVSHGRRPSTSSYTSRMSQLESRFGVEHRRASAASRGSAASRDLVPYGYAGHHSLKLKPRILEPTHFHMNTRKARHHTPLLPEVVVDRTKSDDNESSSSGSECETAKGKLFPDNPFICSTPSATMVDMKDVMVLKDLINHASGKRRSFLSDDGMTKKEYIQQKCMQILFGWECPPGWNKFARLVEIFVMDAFIDLFIILCILINTLFMALDHAGMDAELEKTLQYGNYLFTVIFTLEAMMKVIALSLFTYLKDKWNCFDIIIVFLSLVELGLSGVKGLSILRSFRLLRVFKLAKSWPTLNLLIGIIGRTMGALGNLCFVLAIIIFIFAVMGMQLFGASYSDTDFFPDGPPRWNFVDFLHSFMIVFRVLCGEWIESMWDCIHCFGYPCIPFFLLTMIIGNLVVLNLFLALLLSSFGAESLQQSQDDSEPNKLQEGVDRINRFVIFVKSHVMYCIKVKIRGKRIVVDDYDPTITRTELSSKDMMDGGIPMRNGKIGNPDTSPDCDEDGPHDRRDLRTLTLRLVKGTSKSPHVGYSPVSPYDPCDHDDAGEGGDEAPTRPASTGSASSIKIPLTKSKESKLATSTSCHSKASLSSAGSQTSMISEGQYSYSKGETESIDKDMDPNEAPEINEVNVVFVRYPDDCCPKCCTRKSKCCAAFDKTTFGQRLWTFRCYMFRLVEHNYFETFIIVMILASSLALAIEDVNITDPSRVVLKMILDILDKIFTVVFIFEMLIKWSAYGFKKYFTDAWCWLDFVIVAISLVSLAAEQAGLSNIGAFRALRTLRALRPLRAVSRWEGMKVVVNALIQAIPSIFNVMMVCLVFWLIFGIMGVQLFGGLYWHCIDEDRSKVNYSIVHNKTECIEQNYTWYNPNVNFDNVLSAYLSLLQVATFKGWTDVMNNAIDSQDRRDEQHDYEVRVYWYLYFVLFIVFGSFFTLNLFIGVIIDNFNMQKKKMRGSLEMFMTEDQKKYYNAMKKLGSKQPQKPIPKPRFKCQLFFFKLTTNQNFDIGIMSVILLNMISMAIEHYGQNDELTQALIYVNQVFIAIFTLECVMKILGLRQFYFKEPWNVFDFVVVVLSILGIAMADVFQNLFVSPTLLRVVRVFRVGRVLRLVKSAKGIRTLLFSLAVSLPALFNIGLLLFLVMFIYAIFGMSFFMHVKNTYGLDEMFNFQTFGQSMIVLFQVSTSGGWDGVLAGLMNSDDCSDAVGSTPSDCGSPVMGMAYLITYLVITFLVIINMYIAVILENFSQATEDVQQGLTQDDFDMYYEVWEKYDEQATQYIGLGVLAEFVAELEEPLCLPKPNHFKLVRMDIPIIEDEKVHCVDILDALTKNFLGTTGDTVELGDVAKKPDREGYVIFSSTKKRPREHVSARIIQRVWKDYLARKGSSSSDRGNALPPCPEETIITIHTVQEEDENQKEDEEVEEGYQKDNKEQATGEATDQKEKGAEEESENPHDQKDREDKVREERDGDESEDDPEDSRTVELFPESGVVA